MIERRLPPLNSLRVFEAAARHQSFVRAADELCVTHGAVSRQIKQLESSLGVELFQRRNRAVFLTHQGSELLETCSDILSRLATAVHKIQAPSENLPLVVSCEPTIAMRWLIPRLGQFRSCYPMVKIHLLAAGGDIDFARDRVDLALRRNDIQPGARSYVETVAPEMMGPVCAPSMRNKGTVQLLHARTRISAWPRWFEMSNEAIDAGANEYFEHFYLSLQAASSGLGMAIGSAYMVVDDLRDGRLLAPFAFTPDGSDYVLLSPTPFIDDERRASFLEWIRHEMEESRGYVKFSE